MVEVFLLVLNLWLCCGKQRLDFYSFYGSGFGFDSSACDSAIGCDVSLVPFLLLQTNAWRIIIVSVLIFYL